MNSVASTLKNALINIDCSTGFKENASISHVVPTVNVFVDTLRAISVTGDHRDNFKAFIHTYSGIHEALQTCLKSIERIASTEGPVSEPSSGLCRVYADIIRSIASPLRSETTNDMKRMKTAAKEKLQSMESELRQSQKEFQSLVSSLSRMETAFEKTQSEAKNTHARTLDSVPSQSWILSPLTNVDKDKLFTKLQRLKSDGDRIYAESQQCLSEISSRHVAIYTRANQSITELASMRRRLNRRIIAEVRLILPRMEPEIKRILSNQIPSILEGIEKQCPSEGGFDFGMSLSQIDTSLSNLTGGGVSDRRRITETANLLEFRATQTYIAKEEGEISFTRNERVVVIETDPSGWWKGRNHKGEEGVFPCVYVAQRPAGAPLPPSIHASSHGPHLKRNGASWQSTQSVDERVAMIRSSPPETFIARIHFAFFSDEIFCQVGDQVVVSAIAGDEKHVFVRNQRGQTGTVPLNIMSLKELGQENCSW